MTHSEQNWQRICSGDTLVHKMNANSNMKFSICLYSQALEDEEWTCSLLLFLPDGSGNFQ